MLRLRQLLNCFSANDKFFRTSVFDLTIPVKLIWLLIVIPSSFSVFHRESWDKEFHFCFYQLGDKIEWAIDTDMEIHWYYRLLINVHRSKSSDYFVAAVVVCYGLCILRLIFIVSHHQKRNGNGNPSRCDLWFFICALHWFHFIWCVHCMVVVIAHCVSIIQCVAFFLIFHF